MHAQINDGDPAIKAETDRRLETIEDLLGKLLRFGVFVAAIIVVLGVFDLWSVLAGLGLVLAALTLAGQSIILDYLMGLLILTEGQSSRATSSASRPSRAPSRRSACAARSSATCAAWSTRSPTARSGSRPT